MTEKICEDCGRNYKATDFIGSDPGTGQCPTCFYIEEQQKADAADAEGEDPISLDEIISEDLLDGEEIIGVGDLDDLEDAELEVDSEDLDDEDFTEDFEEEFDEEEDEDYSE